MLSTAFRPAGPMLRLGLPSTPPQRGNFGRGPLAGRARFSIHFRARSSSLRADRAAFRRTSSLAGAPHISSREREVRGRASVPGLKPCSGSAAVPFPGAVEVGGHVGKAGARRRPERFTAPPVILRGVA